jgi:hypothetical protein
MAPRPVQYLPAEGTNFEALAMRSAEQAIDSLLAQNWEVARALFEQCARCCAEAYAVHLREEAARMREQGYACCGHCQGWAWPADMHEIPAGYPKKGEDATPQSVYRCCPACWEKIR